MVYVILIGYIAIVFLGSLRGAKKDVTTPEGYFLANRNLGTLALFFTILATNFSAFYFLGFAGAGYRIGYSHYVVMAFGTGFACLSFFLLGTKIWRLGKQKGYITPAELIRDQTGSLILAYLYSGIMLLFTFPYLALQIIGSGYILEAITQGQVPYFLGATLLTLFTIGYVWIGGMKSVAKTDLKQGMLAITLMLAAVMVIGNSLGGLTLANEKVFEIQPELFFREGMGNAYPPQKWFSMLIFWMFCIPMFPQIFMRFYIAKNLPTLKKSALLYGLIPLFISILPVIIGVLGHLTFPDLMSLEPELMKKETDQILPKMLLEHSPEWFAALVMTGALAAFMSTLDSQLLALSTMVTRDFILPYRKKIDLRQQVFIGRIWVVIIAFIGLAIAAQPFTTIFDMGKLAFSGLAILFPVTLMILRGGGVNPKFGIASILVGVLLLLGFYYKIISSEWLFGFESPIIVLAVSFLIVLLGKLVPNK
ncbi:MAG: sodium:solute symporter family protein [Saprospiraceae bacterium]|jgi:SSS family solute:Na+ symporter|nr:sodium:solute symporter family protein [Saprospiraceae bacterium]